MTLEAPTTMLKFLPAREIWAGRRCPVMPTTVPGSLAGVLQLLGIEPDETADGSACTVPVWRVRGGATLFHEGARTDSLHLVRSGTLKCVKTAEDGYEQVLAFAASGDVLGFEALSAGREPIGAVALEDSSVYVLALRELDAWRHRFPALDRGLQLALSRRLAHSGEAAEMMAAVAAEARLARFVLWLSARMAERGQSPRRLRLRMSRRDIASFLGVAHETVSRSFGVLAECGCLRVENRELEIVDVQALRACARSTRGLVGETMHRAAA
jgi:CRP/FNR family transcriptional regulator, anaerobic regulatory protein